MVRGSSCRDSRPALLLLLLLGPVAYFAGWSYYLPSFPATAFSFRGGEGSRRDTGTKKNDGDNNQQHALMPLSSDENSSSRITRPPLAHNAPFSFSACLVMKDEIRILPEWLAYHYEVLPLRRLIIMADMGSITSPESILTAYEEIGLKSDLWEAKDVKGYAEESHFLLRQATFYQRCAWQLKSEGEQYVAIIDTDEYISFNYENAGSEHKQNATLLGCRHTNGFSGVPCRSDGSPFHMLQYLNLSLPKLGEGTIAGFMSQLSNTTVVDRRPGSLFCEILPRTNLYALTDGSIVEPSNMHLPPGFDYKYFRTLRERVYTNIRSGLPGKSILNLQHWAGRRPIKIHRANKRCFGYYNVEPSLSFFRVHQYTGTLDEFLVPTILTRTKGYFEARNRNHSAGGRVDDVSGWLISFIRRVGRYRAHNLTVKLQQLAIDNLRVAVSKMQASENDATAPRFGAG